MCVLIYFIWRLRPCCRPPWQQATAGWWPAEMCHFCLRNLYFADPEASFWFAERLFWWSRSPQGHPMNTLRPRCEFLSILGSILGASWDPLWIFVRECFRNVSVFGMIRGGGHAAWILWLYVFKTQSKTHVFKIFHFFHLFTNCVSGGRFEVYFLVSFQLKVS